MRDRSGSLRWLACLFAILGLSVVSLAYEHGDAVPGDFVMPKPLTLDASVQSLQTREGLSIDLVAAEPMTMDPVYFDWDIQGRLWIVEMADYPLGLDGKGKPGGRVRYLTDTDNDGEYDQSTLFLEGLNCPTGVMAFGDGVIVAAAPEIFYAEDRDGDGKADVREVLYRGFKEGNQQHRVNGFAWGLDGWIHVANGDSGGTITSVKTGETEELGSRDLKIHPESGGMELVSGRTQYGRSRDDWGNWFGCNNTMPLWQYMPVERYKQFNPHVIYPAVKHLVPAIPAAPPVFPLSTSDLRYNDPHARSRITSACSSMIHRGVRLGQDYQNIFFTCEPVHNLVHREVLHRDRFSYRASRAADEPDSEFLASSDAWFRPVCVKTGPDGAIYVADMHRYVIEHPEWIPEEWQKVLDVRAGEDRGRIYRIRSGEVAPVSVAAGLDGKSCGELVSLLNDANGWIRDHSHRLLLEHREWKEEDLELLQQVAVSKESGAGSVHAFALLAEMDKVGSALLMEILGGDQLPDVKAHALRLAGAMNVSVELSSLANQSSSLDHEVLMFLASGSAHEEGVDVLNQIATSEWSQDEYIQSALLAALPGYVDGVAGQVRNWSLKEKPFLLRGIVDTAVATNDFTLLAAAVEIDGLEFTSVAVLSEVLDRRKVVFRDWITEHHESLPERLRNPVGINEEAVATARLKEVDVDRRKAAIGLLGRFPGFREPDIVALNGLIQVQESGEVRVAAAKRLLELDEDGEVFESWESFAGNLRSQILQYYLASNSGALELLDLIRNDMLSSQSLPADVRQNLVGHLASRVRIPAKELLGGVESERASILESYREKLSAERSPEKGRQLFAAHCSACHEFGGIGTSIGADLHALKDRSDLALLRAILDPNAAVEDKFMLSSVEMEDGTFVSGMLAEESAGTLTFMMLDGTMREVSREKVKQFSNSNRSFMPEGLEAVLDPDNISDLISFLQSKS